jgi:adenosylcobinamide-GDP ribazoletransferase
MGAIRALVSLFTVIPVNSNMKDYEHLSRRFWYLPLVGVLFGIVAAASFAILSQLFGGLLAAVGTMMILQGFNRFLHFDGLMDLGDGLVAHGDMEKKLGAMKDSFIGAGGVAFALFFILLSISALASLPINEWEILVLVPFAMEILSRNAMLSCTAMGTPRPGLGSTFVTNTGKRSIIRSVLLSTVLIMMVWLGMRATAPSWSIVPYQDLLAMPDQVWMLILTLMLAAISTMVGAVMSRVARKSFGCVNGDVIGATNEISRPIMIMAMIMLLVVP